MNRYEKENKFPDYFRNFEMPQWARGQNIEVYRACPTGKADKLSFLSSYEENGYQISVGGDKADPQEYSLSSYIKFRDIKRFMTMDSRYGIPFAIARGYTKPIHGISLETKEWKKMMGIKYKGSHVDWWLYEDARPYMGFEVINHDN